MRKLLFIILLCLVPTSVTVASVIVTRSRRSETPTLEAPVENVQQRIEVLDVKTERLRSQQQLIMERVRKLQRE